VVLITIEGAGINGPGGLARTGIFEGYFRAIRQHRPGRHGDFVGLLSRSSGSSRDGSAAQTRGAGDGLPQSGTASIPRGSFSRGL